MMANTRVELNVAGILGELRDAANWLVEAAEAGLAAHDVERGLFRKVLELGRRMFDTTNTWPPVARSPPA